MQRVIRSPQHSVLELYYWCNLNSTSGNAREKPDLTGSILGDGSYSKLAYG